MLAGRKQSSERKSEIMQTARKIIWEKGYEKASIRDIARACSFEPSNIYNYFSNKEQLLIEILHEEVEYLYNLVKHLDIDETTSPLDQLRFIIVSHIDLTLGGRRVSGMTFDIALKSLSAMARKNIVGIRDKYESILRKVIRRGIERGEFVEVDEKMAAIMIISMIVRTRLWYSPGGENTPHEIADIIFNLAVNGFINREVK